MLIELASGKDILIGKLGYVSFPKAFYAYVGSAMNGFKARLAHHLRDKKKPHWHIDYLLREAKLMEIILCPSKPFASYHSESSAFCHSEGEKRPVCVPARTGRPKNLSQDKLREESHSAQDRLRPVCVRSRTGRVECFLAQALALALPSIPGFGASDCKCKSHLYFEDKKDKLISKVIEAVNQAGLAYKIFFPEGRRKWHRSLMMPLKT